MTSHKVTVGIYNPETQKTIYLNAGDPTDRYFTNISWAPDAKSLYLIELNRDQNHAFIHAVEGEQVTFRTPVSSFADAELVTVYALSAYDPFRFVGYGAIVNIKIIIQSVSNMAAYGIIILIAAFSGKACLLMILSAFQS